MKTASNGMFHFDTYETKLSNTTLTEHLLSTYILPRTITNMSHFNRYAPH